MAIKREEFFRLPDGKAATLYTLTSPEGDFTVGVSDYGAVVYSILVPDRDGRLRDVALGFGNTGDYQVNAPAFGAVIGRVANRIDRGSFEIDGRTWQLTCNCPGYALHGGRDGYQFRLWRAEAAETDGRPRLKLTLDSPDGDQGFPGWLHIELEYRLEPGRALALSYRAVCDAPTAVNLTNHCYFNLDGESAGTVFNHLFTLEADARTAVDARLIPTGEIVPVAGTPYDLNRPVRLPQPFDDNFVLSGARRGTAYSPDSGIELEFVTDQPGVQLYTANGLDGSTVAKDGKTHPRYGGFCLEAQKFPDAPHHGNFPSIVLRPGETYCQDTVYRFGLRLQ